MTAKELMEKTKTKVDGMLEVERAAKRKAEQEVSGLRKELEKRQVFLDANKKIIEQLQKKVQEQDLELKTVAAMHKKQKPQQPPQEGITFFFLPFYEKLVNYDLFDRMEVPKLQSDS